ncbi:acetylglutamate kinase [Niallia sp. Krafla_26]|uniref:acetylglutamate kinase n=1 Tax=Niallia sp. Krafla_26 TaxID=3064703 RepID=UPI003D181ECD
MRKIVIKCGGSILDELTPDFFKSLKDLQEQGNQLIFVHGGGPDINKMLSLYEVEPVFYNGLRKTTEQTLEIAELVLSGLTNRKLIQKLTENGFQAFGINGSDANLLQADYVDQDTLGFVGEITSVNNKIISLIMQEEIVPVLTPIAIHKSGQKLNVNADYAAAAVAQSVGAEQCIFVTDVAGIMVNGKVVDSLEKKQVEMLIENGTIYGGMIPKVTSAMSALDKGLSSVMIVSGTSTFYDGENWKGTKIIGKE